jgi:hypothetical protein
VNWICPKTHPAIRQPGPGTLDILTSSGPIH